LIWCVYSLKKNRIGTARIKRSQKIPEKKIIKTALILTASQIWKSKKKIATQTAKNYSILI